MTRIGHHGHTGARGVRVVMDSWGWTCTKHFMSRAGHHEPLRGSWRALLKTTPEPPFTDDHHKSWGSKQLVTGLMEVITAAFLWYFLPTHPFRFPTSGVFYTKSSRPWCTGPSTVLDPSTDRRVPHPTHLVLNKSQDLACGSGLRSVYLVCGL